MRHVILRDDDTNALTPVSCLEQLYRPFLERGLPVNLAAIPNVATGTIRADGRPEEYLAGKNGSVSPTLPIGENLELTRYLLDNPGYHVAQHGCRHDYFEFDGIARQAAADRLEQGTELLMKAGFPRPKAFVAPYDKFSRAALGEAAKRFPVLSGGWYESRRVPYSWLPRYFSKKLFHRSHWRVGTALLLSHPGCILSRDRPRESMLAEVKRAVQSGGLTVLVTHWWEYFPGGRPDSAFIECLHQTASYLADDPEIRVISLGELAGSRMRLN